MGEDLGRYFMSQLIDMIEFLHTDQKIVHLNLRLDNIWIDENYNLVLSDFGNAEYQKIDQLS